MEDPPRRRPGELSQLPHYRKRKTSVPLAEVLNDALTGLWVDKRLAAASVAFHIAEDVDRVLRPCTVGAFPLDQEGVAFLLLEAGRIVLRVRTVYLSVLSVRPQPSPLSPDSDSGHPVRLTWPPETSLTS